MNHEALISLAVYFVLMLGIGLYAYRKSTSDVSEYMLGGRQLHPAVGALSAGASDMSGWMLMGLPGAVFVSGFSAAWSPTVVKTFSLSASGVSFGEVRA